VKAVMRRAVASAVPQSAGAPHALLRAAQKKNRSHAAVCALPPSGAELLFLPEDADIGSLRALLALRHFEFNALVFGQGFETAALDFLEVREEILATAIRCDEPKTLAFIEPLNQSSFSHINPFGECRRHADIEETLTNHRTS
jgi:hypothetical protein